MEKKFYTTSMTPELMCENIQKSLSFYIDVLGFNVQYQRMEEGFAMLERQGSRLMLDQIVPDSKRAFVTGALEKPFGRGINLQIQTSDVTALYSIVQRGGGAIFLELEEKWYRREDTLVGNRQFIVLDADGYMLRFYEDMGFKNVGV